MFNCADFTMMVPKLSPLFDKWWIQEKTCRIHGNCGPYYTAYSSRELVISYIFIEVVRVLSVRRRKTQAWSINKEYSWITWKTLWE